MEVAGVERLAIGTKVLLNLDDSFLCCSKKSTRYLRLSTPMQLLWSVGLSAKRYVHNLLAFPIHGSLLIDHYSGRFLIICRNA